MRRLRESAGLTVGDIAAETKISARILQALEGGKFEYLPESVFSRNFVRQYAGTIGFDPDRLVEWFDAAWERYQLASGSHPSLVVEELPPKRTISWRFWAPLVLAAIILFAVAVVVLRGRDSQDPAGFAAASAGATGGTRLVPSPTGPAMAPTIAPVPEPDEEVRREEVAFAVVVAPERECWIRYRDREGRSEQSLLSGGRRVRLTLQSPVLLTLGNAGAAEIEVGGSTYGQLGGPGEVVHLEVTSGGIVEVGSGATDG